MASIVMGRLFFYAQASIVSNLFQHGFGHEDHHRHVEKPVVQKPQVVPPVVGASSSSSYSPKESDLILDLPGLEDFDPGFDQYAGYLTVDEDHQRKIFYWYVESQGSPKEDPVMLWTNGGPGCSGFLGLGTEHGPFFLSDTGELSPNPFSWNLVANMLYIEQPAGVGFSYSENSKDYNTGDQQAAADNYQVIRQFLERFPERQSNDFYISSESYGGHYMPQCTFLLFLLVVGVSSYTVPRCGCSNH
jgi:serine carboxypeptidase-like clade 2